MTCRSAMLIVRPLIFAAAVVFAGAGGFVRGQTAPQPRGDAEPAKFEVPAEIAPLAPTPNSQVDLASASEPAAKSAAGASNSTPLKPDEAAAPTSDAERISRLERAIEDGEKRLGQLKANLSDPQGEYATAEAEFKKLDGAMEEARQTLREATEAAVEDDIAAAKQAVADIEPQWNLAKQRFEVELQERRVLKENIAIVEQKLQSDREASDKLKGVGQAASPAASAGATSNGTPVPAGPNAAATPVAANPPGGSSTAGQSATANASPPIAATPLAPVANAPPEAAQDAAAQPAATPVDPKTQKAPSKELVEAKQVAEQSAAAADAAEKEVRSITERIAILQKSIKMERELRDAVRKKVDITEESLKGLEAELGDRMGRGEDTEQQRLKISESTRRLREYRDEARRVTTQLDKLQSELGTLQAEQLAAFEVAEKKRTIADAAQEQVEHLKNPFTARNVMQWSLDHGPRLLSILVAMAALVWISRMMQSRLVRLMAGRGPRGNRDERENRAKTLVSVFHNAANLVLIGGGAIMVLEEIGIPIGPLVGGAAVVGLAVAFGAQSLIKDYFTGFILLLEQQYLINDVIRVGDIAGQVERISLRMTVLRDLEGRVHFIPHGEMSSVTNMTHGWSRAVMEIGVAYKENVDRVIATINELGREMRRDKQFSGVILEDLTMLGVDSLGDSAVVIKLFIKTEPLQQWTVKREFLRRVKNRFDELGIEIPFPHRTVYHRQEAAANENGQSDGGDVQGWSRKNAA
ncbi:MAG: mechanosensitive ion channel domain-containing protein [Pirellulales bacterium]